MDRGSDADYRTRPALRPCLQAFAWVAQLVEQRIENPRVAGSIPAPGTICLILDEVRAPQRRLSSNLACGQGGACVSRSACRCLDLQSWRVRPRFLTF